MVAKFDMMGNPTPARFAYEGKVIDIEQIVSVAKEKIAGNRMKLFVCQSEIEGKLRRFELKNELQTCKWILWKM